MALEAKCYCCALTLYSIMSHKVRRLISSTTFHCHLLVSTCIRRCYLHGKTTSQNLHAFTTSPLDAYLCMLVCLIVPRCSFFQRRRASAHAHTSLDIVM